MGICDRIVEFFIGKPPPPDYCMSFFMGFQQSEGYSPMDALYQLVPREFPGRTDKTLPWLVLDAWHIVENCFPDDYINWEYARRVAWVDNTNRILRNELLQRLAP